MNTKLIYRISAPLFTRFFILFINVNIERLRLPMNISIPGALYNMYVDRGAPEQERRITLKSVSALSAASNIILLAILHLILHYSWSIPLVLLPNFLAILFLIYFFFSPKKNPSFYSFVENPSSIRWLTERTVKMWFCWRLTEMSIVIIQLDFINRDP